MDEEGFWENPSNSLYERENSFLRIQSILFYVR
jgi:hypothetical protein